MTSIILLALGIIIGVPLGAMWCARRRDQAPIELPPHEHLWEPWEHESKHPVHKGTDRPTTIRHVQVRRCYTCGWAERATHDI
ncbi:hypothetical protein [Corynebacterium kalidii]